MMLQGISELIKSVNHMKGKKGVSEIYLGMVGVAADLSVKQLKDMTKNRNVGKISLTGEEEVRLLEKLFNYHLENQIKLYVGQK